MILCRRDAQPQRQCRAQRRHMFARKERCYVCHSPKTARLSTLIFAFPAFLPGLPRLHYSPSSFIFIFRHFDFSILHDTFSIDCHCLAHVISTTGPPMFDSPSRHYLLSPLSVLSARLLSRLHPLFPPHLRLEPHSPPDRPPTYLPAHLMLLVILSFFIVTNFPHLISLPMPPLHFLSIITPRPPATPLFAIFLRHFFIRHLRHSPCHYFSYLHV